jgi:glycosyltransferase involved in cell wall biosynthesis
MIPLSRRSFDPAAPIEVVGYLSMTAGVGESARLCVDALAQGGRPVGVVDVSTHPDERRDVEWTAPNVVPQRPATRILHLNPPMLPRAIFRIGLGNFAHTYNIGYWAWELEVIPEEWKRALRYMNAVLVPSEFTRAAISAHTDKPVIVVPHPVAERQPATAIRAQFGIADDAFLVSSIFSAGSSINRKNPYAVLEAFRRFSAGHPGAALLMKASGNPATDPHLRALIASAAESGQVRVVTDNLPASVVNAIISQSDAYVSLHRSEGFGLTVAEAILAGTPVVSTAWSGTVDFCDPDNTWGVGCRLIPVSDSHPEFADLKDARWADADAGEAADMLGRIAADRTRAAHMAHHAKGFLKRYLSERTYDRALGQIAHAQEGGR